MNAVITNSTAQNGGGAKRNVDRKKYAEKFDPQTPSGSKYRHGGMPNRAEPSRAKPSRAKLSWAEPSRAEPSRAKPSREPSRAEPSRAELSRAEPSRAEPSRAEPGRAGASDGRRDVISIPDWSVCNRVAPPTEPPHGATGRLLQPSP